MPLIARSLPAQISIVPELAVDPVPPSTPRSTVPVVAPCELDEDVPADIVSSLLTLETIARVPSFAATSVPLLRTVLPPVSIVSVTPEPDGPAVPELSNVRWLSPIWPEASASMVLALVNVGAGPLLVMSAPAPLK